MNKQKTFVFLFSIAKEIEQSFHFPVILFTEKDYLCYVVQSMINMHIALQNTAKPIKLVEIIKSFHFEWLQAVQEIETLKTILNNLPREVILKAICFTLSRLEDRYTFLCNYIKEMQTSMTNEEKQIINANLDIIAEVKQISINALREKEKRILTLADHKEYLNQIYDELEELSNWLDNINDNLAFHFCKILDLKVSVLPSDLTKTLKQIIEEVSCDPDPEAQRLAGLLLSTGKQINNKSKINSLYELEIGAIIREIKELENRLSKMKISSDQSGTMVLKHKKIYLEDKLKSLKNEKLSLIHLKCENTQEQGIEEHIFNHVLPHAQRCRLVEQLIKIWNASFAEYNNESIISILNVADLEEVFSDGQGQFTVDKYGRKIYRRDKDPNLYQLNETNTLVPVQDDEHHIYFYDECGRYYLNPKKQRVYTAYTGASEYLLNKSGVLLKLKEIKDGVEYYYDWLGRYNFNKDGQKVYRDEDSENEYENDGLGNLCKIRGGENNYSCEKSTKTTLTLEENKYLKKEVGSALKECIAKVILHRPTDPIRYLATSLIKYRENIEERQRRIYEKQDIIEERKLYDLTKENSLIRLNDYNMDYEIPAEEPFNIEYEIEAEAEDNDKTEFEMKKESF